MRLITYFKYSYFDYLTTLQTNTQNSLGFSRALPAAHALRLNTQNCAWFGSQVSVICCELSGGFAPGSRCGTSVPHTLCAPYLQILATPLLTTRALLMLLLYCIVLLPVAVHRVRLSTGLLIVCGVCQMAHGTVATRTLCSACPTPPLPSTGC